jgi:hypothetical protein
MSESEKAKLDAGLERLSRRLPDKIGHHLRKNIGPSSALIRIPIGVALIVGGIFSFLPVLGLWMIPLGLALIARDVSFLRPPLIRLLDWIEKKWPQPDASR